MVSDFRLLHLSFLGILQLLLLLPMALCSATVCSEPAALHCSTDHSVPISCQSFLSFSKLKTFNVNPNFKKEEIPQSQIKLQTEYVLIRL